MYECERDYGRSGMCIVAFVYMLDVAKAFYKSVWGSNLALGSVRQSGQISVHVFPLYQHHINQIPVFRTYQDNAAAGIAHSLPWIGPMGCFRYGSHFTGEDIGRSLSPPSVGISLSQLGQE